MGRGNEGTEGVYTVAQCATGDTGEARADREWTESDGHAREGEKQREGQCGGTDDSARDHR